MSVSQILKSGRWTAVVAILLAVSWAGAFGQAKPGDPHQAVKNAAGEAENPGQGGQAGLGEAENPNPEADDADRETSSQGEAAGEGGQELVEEGFESEVSEAEARAAAETMTAEEAEKLESLPSIEELLFGQELERVFAPDGRRQVTNTTVVPFRRNCQLILTLSDGRQARGTGWFIGPRTVITAGHCVHTGGASGSWMRSIQVIPGMNGRSMPFGSATSSSLRSVAGWTGGTAGNPDNDYGAIILANGDLGNRVGGYGFASYSDSTLQNLLVNLYGYPADKPYGTQWGMAGPITGVLSRQLKYTIDSAGGQSGSCVYRLTGGQRYGVGIHAYGHSDHNRATRITRPVFDNLKRWKDSP